MPRVLPSARALTLALTLAFTSALCAQTPPPPAKRLPPAGIAIPDTARAELAAGAAALRAELDAAARELAAPGKTRFAELLPDAEIFHKAVDWALRYDEFFDLKQIDAARRALAAGRERLAELRAGRAPWTETPGTSLRGYKSALDLSIQPYALTLPASWKKTGDVARRLDVVLLGRGEKRTELAFIGERERPPRDSEIVPPEAIILTPYGRFCNATKFAGEIDVFEALAAVRRAYKVDAARTVVRGFSMGGASTWHLAVHHPDTWVAASPGAGFAETAVYAKALAPGKPPRTPWEQTLWRWYDATGYAGNLANLPVVAYSGEIDPQKQAADIMAQAMAAEGLTLEHLIGPKTAHKYHPETKATLATRLDTIVAAGRDAFPKEERFTTYTLRYPKSGRIRLMELEKHWERADVRLRFTPTGELAVTTKNVAVFSLVLERAEGLRVVVDGQPVVLGNLEPYYWFAKTNGRWTFQDKTFAARWRNAPRKTPGLTGPVNDAFLTPFLFVKPTGRPLNPAVGAWADAEFKHAVKMWRDLFRGEVLVKDDTAVTADDLAQRNLVLWGDVSSNRLIAQFVASGKTPLAWDAGKLTVRGAAYDAAHHAPVLIFPNPLSPQPRYVVLNSGIDFRDEAYGTNSLQTAKLPDFAVVDLREAPGPRWPGKIAAAGFFDEAWK